MLEITSTASSDGTEYDLHFTRPSGTFTTLAIDGVNITTIYDGTGALYGNGTPSELTAIAANTPVTLRRKGSTAFFKAGGGLNYAVVAVASEAALPSTARENTIAFITSTTPKKVVFANSSTGYAFTTGDVWILTDRVSSAPANLLKNDVGMVYPSVAYQWNGSAFSPKPAFTYLDGAWKRWRRYIYYQGDQYVGSADEPFTDGYSGFRTTSGTGYTTGTATINTHDLQVRAADSQNVCIAPVNALDLTGVKRIGYNIKSASGSVDANQKRLSISTSRNTSFNSNALATANVGADGTGEKYLDLTGVMLGPGIYVGFMANTPFGGSTVTFAVDAIWFEY